MKIYSSEQKISQLEKRKGGYFYLTLDAKLVETFPGKRSTRLICILENKLEFQCGLNHLGDGNFFIILSSKNLETVNKKLGDNIKFKIKEDPNPLGVDMPEVLSAVLDQDEVLKEIFDALTLGKKRNVIHTINRIKSIDLQVQKISKLIQDSNKPRPKKAL